MMQNLTELEKQRAKSLHRRGMSYPEVAAGIIVGRHLRELVHMKGEIEAYFEDLKKKGR